MLKKIVFLALILTNLAPSLKLFSSTPQGKAEIVHEKVVTKSMSKGFVVDDNLGEETDGENFCDETDLDDIFGELDPSLVATLDEIDNPDDADKQQVSLWGALKLFWAFPFDIKKEIVSHHLSEHTTAYIVGTVLTVGAAATIVAYSMTKSTKKTGTSKQKNVSK